MNQLQIHEVGSDFESAISFFLDNVYIFFWAEEGIKSENS